MTESLLQRVITQITAVDDDVRNITRAKLAGERDANTDGLAELVSRVAAARHQEQPTLEHKHVVICAADHGATRSRSREDRVDVQSPTDHAIEQIDCGRAAINNVARTADASIVIVDCGVYRPEPASLTSAIPPGVIDLRVGNGTEDIGLRPAMSLELAITSLHTGIALSLSLGDAGADCIALGQIAAGSRAVNDTLIAVLIGVPMSILEPSSRELATRAIQANRTSLHANTRDERDPIEILATYGGFEIGVMAGVVLGAASQHIPVVLDDSGTSAAALLAARLAPAVARYTVASHAGGGLCHKQALHELGLSPLFDIGIAQGEGVGATLAMQMLASAVRLLSAAPP